MILIFMLLSLSVRCLAWWRWVIVCSATPDQKKKQLKKNGIFPSSKSEWVPIPSVTLWYIHESKTLSANLEYIIANGDRSPETSMFTDLYSCFSFIHMVQQQMSDKVSHLNLEELSVLNEPLKREEARIDKEDSKYWTYIHQADTGRRQNICYLCLSTALNGNMLASFPFICLKSSINFTNLWHMQYLQWKQQPNCVFVQQFIFCGH